MPRSILVADDNPIIRKMLCKMFEAEDDYDLCAQACDGVEAIAFAIKHKPELIILRYVHACDERSRSVETVEGVNAECSDYSVHPLRRSNQTVTCGRIESCQRTMPQV
jgi:chemotaxis response regulator CheB